MRATALAVVVISLFGLWSGSSFAASRGRNAGGAGGAGGARAGLRILVTPIVAAEGADSSEVERNRTLTRSVETALRAAIPDVEIVTPAALDAAIELETVRDCVDAEVTGSCLTELADAVDVDYIARPHLGRVGDELVLTLALLDGHRALVVAQGQRRARADRPADLLDAIDALAVALAADAKLGAAASSTRGGGLPMVPIAASVGGAVVAGVGATLLIVRGSIAGPYDAGDLALEDARGYEAINRPFLIGGIGAVVVGTLVTLGGAGLAVWAVVAPGDDS